MKSILKKRTLGFAAMAACMSIISCSEPKSNSESWDLEAIEQEVFDDWMVQNMPEIAKNRQAEGYYINLHSLSSDPDRETTKPGSWVRYNITSYSLDGNICKTRQESMSLQQGKFSLYTHYVPVMDYVTYDDKEKEEDNDALEDDYLDEAIEYVLGAQELNINGEMAAVEIGEGDKFAIYSPSFLAGEVNGQNGYAGQFILSSLKPVIMEIEVIEVMNDEMYLYENENIDKFVALNNNYDWKMLLDDGDSYIYAAQDFFPDDDVSLNFVDTYPYTELISMGRNGAPKTVEAINNKIYSNLVEVYGQGASIDGGYVSDNDDDSLVGFDSDANVWYIVRSLDGFVLDSNIVGVHTVVHLSTGSNVDAIKYNASSTEENSFVDAWFNAIPHLKRKEWAIFVSNSSQLYGELGVKGSEVTSDIEPHEPLIFEVYIE